MGTWGVGAFENDDAVELAEEVRTVGLSAVAGALWAATEGVGYLDASTSQRAVAAAEMVAEMYGDTSPDPRLRSLLTWGESRELIDLARAALDRVVSESELRDLWEEDDATHWHKAIRRLSERIRSRRGIEGIK